MSRLDPRLLLQGYAAGIFPMAEDAADNDIFWVSPDMRGIIPLDGFHLSARRARTVRSDRFTVRMQEMHESLRILRQLLPACDALVVELLRAVELGQQTIEKLAVYVGDRP